MLEKAREVTREGRYSHVTYARYADDLVVLVDGIPRHEWLLKAIDRRLREELAKVQVEVNVQKSRMVDLAKGESFGYLGFEFRRVRSLKGKWRAQFSPQLKKRTALLESLREVFRRFESQPTHRLIEEINPMGRGWVQYFRIGHSSRCFGYVRRWIEKKVRRHMAWARGSKGFGWKRWSTEYLYGVLGLFNDYQVRYLVPPKAQPTP